MRGNNIKRNFVLIGLFSIICIALITCAVAISIIIKVNKIEEVQIVTATPEIISTPEIVVTPHPVFNRETDGGLGPEIFQESEFPGTVVTVEYPTMDYPSGYGSSIKSMRVYLPYGYNEETKYDVLILLHGSGGRDTYWFDEVRWYNDPDYMNSYECHLATLIDNMVANELCNPVIVVSPTYYYSNSWRMEGDLTSRDAYQFREELRNDILPKLANQFSVYDIGDRDHYAFIGASHGAEVGYNSVLPDCLDLFSWFGMVSGCEGSIYSIEKRWETKGFDNLDIKYFYVSAGESDYMAEDTIAGYYEMKNYCSKIDDNNIEYVMIRASGHEDAVWIDAVYNCLLKFFK